VNNKLTYIGDDHRHGITPMIKFYGRGCRSNLVPRLYCTFGREYSQSLHMMYVGYKSKLL